MAIAFVQSAHAVAAAQPISVTLTFTAGNWMIVGATYSTGTTTISGGGNTYTLLAGMPATIPTVSLLDVWYSENIAGGSVTVTISGGAGTSRLTVAEYSGLATSASLDVQNSTVATGTSTTPTSNAITTTNANDLIITATGIGSSTTWTAGTGYTMRDPAPAVTYRVGVEDKIVSSIQTNITATATIGASTGWACPIAAFKAAGGAAAVINLQMLTGVGT